MLQTINNTYYTAAPIPHIIPGSAAGEKGDHPQHVRDQQPGMYGTIKSYQVDLSPHPPDHRGAFIGLAVGAAAAARAAGTAKQQPLPAAL